MKKFYNNPSINISLFEKENVVTTSGIQPEEQKKNAEEAGTAFIKGKLGENAVVLTF